MVPRSYKSILSHSRWSPYLLLALVLPFYAIITRTRHINGRSKLVDRRAVPHISPAEHRVRRPDEVDPEARSTHHLNTINRRLDVAIWDDKVDRGQAMLCVMRALDETGARRITGEITVASMWTDARSLSDYGYTTTRAIAPYTRDRILVDAFQQLGIDPANNTDLESVQNVNYPALSTPISDSRRIFLWVPNILLS